MGYVVNLAVESRQALVVGGGAVAARKVQDLVAAKARVKVVAVEPCEEVRSLAAQGMVAGEWRPFETGDLDGVFLVVAATNNEPLNARIAEEARARNILINVVDRPALCTFTLPATGRRGGLTIAVSTSGQCPSLAGVLRGEIMEQYGPEYAELVELFGKLRKQMIAMGWDGARITRTVTEMYRRGIAGVVASGDQKRLESFLAEFQISQGEHG